MDSPYWLLVIPFAGLFPIFRSGKWNWNVVPKSRLITGLFWLGIVTSIIAFTIVVFTTEIIG